MVDTIQAQSNNRNLLLEAVRSSLSKRFWSTALQRLSSLVYRFKRISITDFFSHPLLGSSNPVTRFRNVMSYEPVVVRIPVVYLSLLLRPRWWARAAPARPTRCFWTRARAPATSSTSARAANGFPSATVAGSPTSITCSLPTTRGET